MNCGVECMHNQVKKLICNISEFISTLKWCLSLSWDASKLYTVSRILTEVLAPVLTLTVAFIGRNVINILAGQSSSTRNTEVILVYLLGGLFIVSVIRSVSQKLMQYCQTMHDDKLNAKIAMIITERTLEANLEYFDNPSFYDKLNSASKDSYSINNVVWNSIKIMSNGISFFIAVAILSQINLFYGLVMVLSAIPASIVATRFTKIIYSLSLEQINGLRQMGYIQAISTERSYAQDLRLYDIKEKLTGRYLRIWKELFVKRQKSSRERTLLLCLLELLPELAIALICLDIAFRVLDGRATVGDYSLLIGLTTQLWSAIYMLTSSAVQIYDNRMQLKNFKSISDYINKVCDTGTVELNDVRSIELRDVTFSYPDTDENALDKLSLCLNKNQKSAIVGLNGSGKSTLIKLLLRFYDPRYGEILINGKDIKDYTLSSLRANFSVYFQDMGNLSFSLSENFEYTSSKEYQEFNGTDVNKKEGAIFSALSVVGGVDIIEKCNYNLNTNITHFFSDDGVELSGGQHQKLALARTLYRKHTALILDEPSSNLDPKAEHYFFEALKELTANKMTIFTSHRLSNTFLADRIIVLENGRIVEDGTQAELLENKQRFSELYSYQAERFNR